jgi:phosphoserine phosphatase
MPAVEIDLVAQPQAPDNRFSELQLVLDMDNTAVWQMAWVCLRYKQSVLEELEDPQTRRQYRQLFEQLHAKHKRRQLLRLAGAQVYQFAAVIDYIARAYVEDGAEQKQQMDFLRLAEHYVRNVRQQLQGRTVTNAQERA